MPRVLRQSVVPLYIFCCLLLGGSTRAPWPNMALQLGAIAILGWAALAPPRHHTGRPGAQLAVMIAGMLAVVLVQLVPLPPFVWGALPGRGVVAHGFSLLRQPLPWMPLSLAPHETLASALWLLPPLAVLAGVLRLAAYRETWVAIAMVLAALGGVLLGALQVAGSSDVSSWYIYDITSTGAAVGFFANANHMAILLVSTLPFLVAMLGDPTDKAKARKTQASAGKMAILGGAMMVVIAGIALNGSLAGVALGAVSLAASLFVHGSLDQPRTRWGLAAVGFGGFAAIAVLAVSPLQNNLTAAGVENDYSSRYTSFANSLRATADHFPAGSGVGSFVDVYPAYENPAWVDRWYVNHVHNDYIESALETGLLGIMMMAVFVSWWVLRAITIWRSPSVDTIARAATVASAAIMLHSLVDYPLRTAAISSVFAFCVAMMVGVRRRVSVEAPSPESNPNARHLTIG